MFDKMTKTRMRTAFRLDEGALKNARELSEKLGISTSRLIELVVNFAAEPELMDTWVEMLVSFKKARREMLRHAKRK